MRLTRLLAVGIMNTVVLFSFCKGVFANQLVDIVSSSESINQCLLDSIETYQGVHSSRILSERSTLPTRHCLDATFSMLQNSILLGIGFNNDSFTNIVEISGLIVVTPEAVLDGVVLADELSNFRANSSANTVEEACRLSNVEDFSYTIAPEHLDMMRVESSLVAIDTLIEQEQANQSVLELKSTLEFVKEQMPNAVNALSQLNMNCTSEIFSITVEDGKASTTTSRAINPSPRSRTTTRTTNGNSTSYSVRIGGSSNSTSRRNQTLIINGETMTIETISDSSKVESSYQGLLLHVGRIAAQMDL